jgi:peptidoglycan/LPS O-acetylase OafA/YrhL
MRGILTFAEFRNLRRFTSLDGLRGISILLVFTAHPVAREYWLFFHGTTGVTIFFVLSGFLITTLLLREEDKYGRVDLVGFYIRRLFRIYPMFFGVFLLYCMLILGLGWEAARRGAFEANIPFFLLLFPEHSFFFNEATASVPFSMSWSIGIEEKFYLLWPMVPFSMSWSIGIEEKFYLLWPILGFTLLVGIRKIRPYVLVALAASTWALSFLPNHWGDAIAPYTHIVFGALVATLLHSERGYAWLSRLVLQSRLWDVTAGFVMAALGAVLMLSSPEGAADHVAGV